jgi:redox-sensitive bicupin YhaK (pirin superfamily)
MKSIFHPAADRGHNVFSWLDSYHSFSFGQFYDENKIHFGALRVLNDDTVAAGMGFGAHPHDNMEIVSIPLSGALEHRDSMGNDGVIYANDVQIMSAGTGIQHSEFNHSKTEEVKFLQIWVFPRERQIEPRYDQKTFDPETYKNQWQILVDPQGVVGVRIAQEAWFSVANIDAGTALSYDIKRQGNGTYFFVLDGKVSIEEKELANRDALGIWEVGSVAVSALKSARVLAIEVPMAL